MSGGGALNLSLLSRGIGEVQKNGHEKVEVFLEPSDYYNFAADRPYYLPPIQPGYHQFAETHSPRISTRSARDGSEIALPKTFTTRKGALLLFSEDMANKTNELDHPHHHRKGRRHHPLNSSFSPHSSYDEDETDNVLKTVDDLAKSILEYGGMAKKTHDYGDDHKIYLKFIHRRREQWERQIRPGYSAKRYLSTWTRNWDDQVFESVVSKGYLTERSLFHYNLFLPNLRRHLFHEDLSNMPQPYRLMKNMLLTPGSLSGYTFYRGMPPGREFSALTEEDEESGDGPRVKRPDTKKSIRVIRTTKEGLQKEVSYSALDKDTQREVITDLLVKSAVHYALSKHEEVAEETVQQAIQSERGDGAVTTYPDPSDPDAGPNKKIAEFDMRSAVDSLLDTNRGGPITLGNDLPDDSQSQSGSEHTGSFKGGAVPHHAAKSMGARQTPRGSWAVAVDDAGKEYMGDVPVAAMRDLSTASSSGSSVPQLPPINRAPLSPIKDVSRETSQFISLPPIQKDLLDAGDGMPTFRVMPPTPQLTNLTGVPTPRSVGDLQKVSETDGTAAEVSGYDLSNESTPTDPTVAQTQRTNRRGKTKGPKVTHGDNFAPVTGVLFQPPERVSHPASHSGFSTTSSHPPIAGSNWDFGRLTEGQGHRTARSNAAGSLDSKSIKGSMIMAPDGEIISVGGSVGPPRPHDVGVISDVTHQQRHVDANATDESGMSDDEPDEWRAGGKKKKTRSMSSKLSDSIKRGIQKRESQSSVGSGIKSTVSSDKSEQYASSRGSIIIKKFSVASKDTDNDSLASGSIQIDYKSGDIDATLSMHSFSYAPKGEEGESGLVKAGSVRSLTGLDGGYTTGHKESLSTAEHTLDGGDASEEDDERWARITEQPEEEEVPTMLESREQTMDVVHNADQLEPSKHPSSGDQQSSGYSSPKRQQQQSSAKNSSVSPRDGAQDSGLKGQNLSPDDSTPSTKQAPKDYTPGPSKTPGASLGVEELIPSANGPRPSPASLSSSHSEDGANDEGNPDEDNKDPGTSRSRSVAMQTDSATSPEQPTPRGFNATPRKASGRGSGDEEGKEREGEQEWPAETGAGGRELLDAVPEESKQSSAAPSRMASSAADKHATPILSRSQTADEGVKPGSKADSRVVDSRQADSKAESRQGSSKVNKSRAASNKRATSRTGSGQGQGQGEAAEGVGQQQEASMTKEETRVTDTSRAKSEAHGDQEIVRAETVENDGEEENAGSSDDAGADKVSSVQVSKEQVSERKAPSRSDQTGSKTGPSPQSDSKTPKIQSKAESRGPSQTSRNSKDASGKSPALASAQSEAKNSSKTTTPQLKGKIGSGKEDSKSRGASSKMSQHSRAKSQAKDGSRSVSTRLSEARLLTPPPGDEGGGHRWDDDEEEYDGARSEHGTDVGIEEYQAPSTPTSGSENDARISGEEPRVRGNALSIEGTQLLTPPESPSVGHRTRMTVPDSVVEEAEIETGTIASQAGMSSVTEQDVLDTLTTHAKRIADSVLSNREAGHDLEKDIRGALEEIMNAQRANSAGPTTAEYKDLIRQSLTTAVARAAGLDPEQFPEDAEISPELLEALVSQKLTPDDIAIYHDEESGRPIIKSRQEIAQALGGVAEGHLYFAPNGKGGSHGGSDVGGIKRQMSIPADRVSLVDNMDYDVISYGGTEVMSERGRQAGRSKAGSKPGSIAGGTIADLKDHPVEAQGAEHVSPEDDNDEFKQRLEQLENGGAKAEEKTPEVEPVLPSDGSPKMQLELDAQSDKSGKTGVSQKTEQSDDSKRKKKAKTPEEPFVVGTVDNKGELEKLYGPVDTPAKSPRKTNGDTNDLKAEDKTSVTSGKSPRLSDKSPRPEDKSPIKADKTPRPEPARAEVEPSPVTPAGGTAGRKEKEPKQKRSRSKKEKKAKEEIEKEPEPVEKEPEEQKIPEVQAPAVKDPEPPAPTKLTEEPRKPEAKEPVAARDPSPKVTEGMPKQKGELSQLYGAQGPGSLPKSESKSPVKGKKPKKDAKKPKGKKGKKGKEATPEVEPAPPAEEVPPPPPVVEEPPPPPPLSPKEPSKPMTASSSERPLQSSPEYKTDSEMEFNIVREEFSPEPDPPKVSIPPPFPEEDELEEEPDEPDDDGTEEDKLKSISNKEARAAKRAAAATKRKEEVERRRKEREEQLKREKEEQERQDQLKREMETERRRREEERRLRKQREAEEAVNEEKAMQDAERRKKQAEDRERRAKEDYQRKLEEMRRKQIEEEAKRLELLMEKQREEAERRAEEELMMSQMAEQERLDYEKKKREEEAERKKKEDAERHQREEEARLAMEEARRLAEEMARKQAELEARLKFNRALQVEASGMECSQDINRAFVFSYFELLQWLGLDIPEFELAKMTKL